MIAHGFRFDHHNVNVAACFCPRGRRADVAHTIDFPNYASYIVPMNNQENACIPPNKVRSLPVSCGTLVVNAAGALLLCHVTNTAKWDIPKGMRDEGESALAAAMRELTEEAGISFDAGRFTDLGSFDYRPDKRLHLFSVRVQDELGDLSQLVCTSFFAHPKSGKPIPETDGFRWVGRDELAQLCWPRMGQLLLSLPW